MGNKGWTVLAAWRQGWLQSWRPRRWMVLALAWALGLACTAGALRAAPAAPPVLLLDDAAGVVALWPAVSWLPDPSGRLGLDDAQARLAARHQAPPLAAGTLGLQPGAAWLAVWLRVPASSDGQWILESAHASVQHLDFHLLDARGNLLAQGRMGALERQSARVPTARLSLRPGQDQLLLLRAQSESPLILPLQLSRPAPYIDNALADQSLQALLAGLSLALLAYALAQAWWHRDGCT